MHAISYKNCVKAIKSDLYRYQGAIGLKGFLKNYFGEPGFRYTFWMRTTAFLSRSAFLKTLYYIARYQRHRLEIKNMGSA